MVLKSQLIINLVINTNFLTNVIQKQMVFCMLLISNVSLRVLPPPSFSLNYYFSFTIIIFSFGLFLPFFLSFFFFGWLVVFPLRPPSPLPLKKKKLNKCLELIKTNNV